MIPKPARITNERYRRWVAAQPCFACGVEGYSQCCHRNGAGMGTKASDYESFPLCCTRPGIPGCHQNHDQLIGISLEERREREDAYVARMLGIARSAGWMIE